MAARRFAAICGTLAFGLLSGPLASQAGALDDNEALRSSDHAAGGQLAFAPHAPAVDKDDEDGRVDATPHRCLRELEVTEFAAAPSQINLGQSTTVRWNVELPPDCSELSFKVIGKIVSNRGSVRLTPVVDLRPSLYVSWPSGRQRKIASTPIKVELPPDLTIRANNQAATLRQALGNPNQVVRITNNVMMDLGHFGEIAVAEGVRVIGARTAQREGPMLFSGKRPRVLFRISGDGVRISGLRIRGADMGVPSDGSSVAIANDSHNNLEIDNNEIYGWKGSAIEIRDHRNQISHLGRPTIHIHDNYLHHNQHVGRLGYGVVVSDGSYALIERNVFDWNRHAIAGDGTVESGYRAYDNLVLPNGGKHRWTPFPGFWWHTHQFDMHGRDNCGAGDIFSDSLYNCGIAGYRIDIRYNAFLYIEQPAIKLRGTPAITPCGMEVINNTFRHTKLGDAVKQTQSGLCTFRNQLGVNSLRTVRRCDINGDGRSDNFLASGQTWWYASGMNKPWTFVKRSTERPTVCPPPRRF